MNSLTLAEQQQLARAGRFDPLILAHLDLVVSACRRWQGQAHHEDLIAEGRLALVQAVRRWDPDAAPLGVYVLPFITGAVCRAARDHESIVHTPRGAPVGSDIPTEDTDPRSDSTIESAQSSRGILREPAYDSAPHHFGSPEDMAEARESVCSIRTCAPRVQQAAALRAEGRTLQEVGDALGVSRQAVHKMLRATT